MVVNTHYNLIGLSSTKDILCILDNLLNYLVHVLNLCTYAK